VVEIVYDEQHTVGPNGDKTKMSHLPSYIVVDFPNFKPPDERFHKGTLENVCWTVYRCTLSTSTQLMFIVILLLVCTWSLIDRFDASSRGIRISKSTIVIDCIPT
jgi:hypothetical protein